MLLGVVTYEDLLWKKKKNCLDVTLDISGTAHFTFHISITSICASIIISMQTNLTLSDIFSPTMFPYVPHIHEISNFEVIIWDLENAVIDYLLWTLI